MGAEVRLQCACDAARFSHGFIFIIQGGAIKFDCVFGARLLEISGSSFIANGDEGVDEVGGEVDASSGPQPVICVGTECNNGNFTCAEYMSYVEAVLKGTIQAECLGWTLNHRSSFTSYTFFNLPEGVTTVLADGFMIADLCPAECSNVVSQVSHKCYWKFDRAADATNTTTQCCCSPSY
jgi:hypothetical protein